MYKTLYDMGYSQSDLCVDVLMRPTRISPHQSGAARPCSTNPSGGARQGLTVRRLRITVCSADRVESLFF